MKRIYTTPLFAVFTVIIASLTLSGCNTTMMYMYGVRNPKIESQKSITAYARKNRMATDNIYALRDSATLMKFFAARIGTPEMRFYNKEGYLMRNRDDQKCNAQNTSLISQLNTENKVAVDSSNNIYNNLSDFRTLDNNAISKDDFKGYDFCVVIYWAKWVGQANKTHIPMWEKEIGRNTGVKIKVLVVTTDYMDFWHPDKNQMIKIYNGNLKKATKTASR